MLLYLKIKPNQRKNSVELLGGQWTIRIKAPAIDGQANDGLIEYLSEVLELPKSRIHLRKGHTSRIKCVEVESTESEVYTRLSKA